MSKTWRREEKRKVKSYRKTRDKRKMKRGGYEEKEEQPVRRYSDNNRFDDYDIDGDYGRPY